MNTERTKITTAIWDKGVNIVPVQYPESTSVLRNAGVKKGEM